MASRICAKTGLALTAGPVRAFRIARESYGPLDPRPRTSESLSPGEGDSSGWSRYDTVGRTIYASEDRLTAYMELLAPFRTEVTQERRALQPVADFMGVPLEDLWRDVVAEWDEQGTMRASWLPRVFREGRAVYTLSFPAGWWIDVTATETIATLNDLSDEYELTSEPLTLSHITGDDRGLTTAIAQLLREHIELDDGTLPLGVEFISKHGRPTGSSGRCLAYWMREVDSGLDEPTRIVSSEPINEGDPDLKAAMGHCKIKSR